MSLLVIRDAVFFFQCHTAARQYRQAELYVIFTFLHMSATSMNLSSRLSPYPNMHEQNMRLRMAPKTTRLNFWKSLNIVKDFFNPQFFGGSTFSIHIRTWWLTECECYIAASSVDEKAARVVLFSRRELRELMLV